MPAGTRARSVEGKEPQKVRRFSKGGAHPGGGAPFWRTEGRTVSGFRFGMAGAGLAGQCPLRGRAVETGEHLCTFMVVFMPQPDTHTGAEIVLKIDHE
ncbi:hypothetical protein [Rhodopila globiformis]|uniref:hypothetical protein n=1 Tax=Rhodopila globiformis TaxID=1071 RepID=UPI0011AFFA8F|nr:hypothetical protein [Rhodopila globiformis]